MYCSFIIQCLIFPLCRYDASLQPTPPRDYGTSHLHFFEDWGVVTFGSALPAGRNHTFLSFKSGKLGGRAIFDIVHQKKYKDWIKGWRNFNAGHEHPDQNSFTFAPNGVPFITEALYGPKYTFLNNVVMFGPAVSESCFAPWEGQVTEACNSKWLKYKHGQAADCHGQVEVALEQQGMVFVRGEGKAAYNSELKIQNFQRNLLLLNPQLLLMVDHIDLHSGSPTHKISAFFHNTDLPFQNTQDDGVHGALIRNGNESYKMFWLDDMGSSERATVGYRSYPRGYPYNGSNYVNVTMPLRNPTSRVAYIFFGPGEDVQSFSVDGDSERLNIYLGTNKHTYTICIFTAEVSTKAQYAIVLTDQKKVVFESAIEKKEQPVKEVEEYVNVVEDNLQHVKPVFQQLERHILSRVLNTDNFHKTAERLLKLSEKRNTAGSLDNIGLYKKQGKGKGGKKTILSDSLPDIFARIEANEKKERQLSMKHAYEEVPDEADDDSRTFIDYSDIRKGRKVGFIKGRKFKEVHVVATAETEDTPSFTSYIRLFLISNIATFFLLLAVLLTRFQRAQSLHTQRFLYCVLLIDSFILLCLYSSCSQTQC